VTSSRRRKEADDRENDRPPPYVGGYTIQGCLDGFGWSPGRVTVEFDALLGFSEGLFENELEFGTAVGGGAFIFVGAFVRLVAAPVPVLYWSLVPP
jgi:hypothetical protein